VILLLAIYPKELKTGYNRDTWTPMFNGALFTIAKLCKQPRCPTTNEWIRKYGIYTQWSITQPSGIMPCCLKVNGCSYVK
jgi:Leu/Phe-tRNA-protein transferase